jgi:Stage II sporulation protein E (SpoIIE)
MGNDMNWTAGPVPVWVRIDASCLLGIVTTGCLVGREFTAQREIRNSGAPLAITLTMRVDSKSLTTFFRDQGIYLCLALVVGAIFWSIGLPINPFTVLLYSLCIGNFLSPPMQWLHALYEKPAPYDWIIFVVLLCIVTVPVYLLSTVIVWLIAPPTPQSLGHLITTGWKMPFLITIVYGLMNFLHDRSKARLERRNVELQSMVRAGAARLEIQDEELQRAREIQMSLLPKDIPQLPVVECSSAWQPARAVGEDYFDVLKLGENRLAICIADVSGKGVPAAPLMANVQASLRASVRDLDSPARVCSIIKNTEVVVAALSQHVRKLPATLRRSLTWDRGLEMAKHKDFTVATDVQVYFCDPQSPWQRGTNENTHLLLRQYFPRGTDLSVHSQAQLDQVALRLNQRPRKTLGFATPASKLQASVASTI